MSAESLIKKLEKRKLEALASKHFYEGIDACIAIVRRHYEGRSAVDRKPLEIMTRDELLAYIRQHQGEQSAPWFTDPKTDIKWLHEQVQEAMGGASSSLIEKLEKLGSYSFNPNPNIFVRRDEVIAIVRRHLAYVPEEKIECKPLDFVVMAKAAIAAMGAVTPDGVLSREEHRQKTCAAPASDHIGDSNEMVKASGYPVLIDKLENAKVQGDGDFTMGVCAGLETAKCIVLETVPTCGNPCYGFPCGVDGCKTEAHRRSEIPDIATVEETFSGPVLRVYGVTANTWLGRIYTENAYEIAGLINRAAAKRQPEPVSVSLHALAGWLHGRYSGERRRYEELDSKGRKEWRTDAKIIVEVYVGGICVD